MSHNKKRGYLCAVKSCNTRYDGRTIFFQFPKGDLVRCKDWLRLCSREELMNKTDENYFYNNLRVCTKHFENNMFFRGIRQRMERPSCSYVKPTDITPSEPVVSFATVP